MAASREAFERLVEAIQRGDDDAALALLERMPELADHHEGGGPGAIHWAAYKRRPAVVRHLVGLGVDLDRKETKFDATPVGWANEGGHADILDLLLEAGAGIDLSRAAAAGRLDVVRRLLDQGEPLLEASTDDWLPLAQAAGWGRDDVLAYLLAAGAPLDAPSRGGTTALHAAVAWHGHAGAAQRLLDGGADPSPLDDDGHTPLDMAIARDRHDLAALLRARGGLTGRELEGLPEPDDAGN
ncbi:MAG: ankyrin repeat domain-containing protein [Longimicrobiales bacterium]